MQNLMHGNTKHGNARRGNKTTTYLRWESMIRRCYLKSQDSYHLYGGRGITVCDEWRVFENFLADMGQADESQSLDRIDIDKGYSKDNCRWVSSLEQARNKRSTRWLTYKGETRCLTEWADIIGIKPKTLRARLDDHKWDVDRALTTATMTSRDALVIAQASLKQKRSQARRIV